MQYYRLLDADDLQDRWYLKNMWDAKGVRLDPREFCQGKLLRVVADTVATLTEPGEPVLARLPLRIGVHTANTPLEFTLGPFEVPVTSPTVTTLLCDLAGSDLQVFPASVDGHPENYSVVNAAASVDCLALDRCMIDWWQEKDGRPDKIGLPRSVSKMIVDPAKTGGRHFFRVANWRIALIASEVVRREFEAAKVSGVFFKQV